MNLSSSRLLIPTPPIDAYNNEAVTAEWVRDKKYATEGYVNNKIESVINNAPEALDTLKELADALDNDSNFASNIINMIDEKFTSLDIDKNHLPISGGTMTGSIIFGNDDCALASNNESSCLSIYGRYRPQ